MVAQIRILNGEDASIYRELRLRALREHPEAYATSYEEEAGRPAAEMAGRLAPEPGRVTQGAFDDGRLVGTATLICGTKPKLRNRATLVAMYVAPEARGQGLGRALLGRLVELAGEWGVSDVALGVTVGNEAARSLYAAAGFEPYGVEPRSLWIDGRFYDVELMNLRLGVATPNR